LKILADLGDPDPELAEKARLYRYRARRQVFRITLQPGLAYDSNVTYTGTGGTGLGQISGRGDGCSVSDVRIDYAPVATEREALTVGARLADTWHFSVESFDLQDYGGYVRYARN